MSARSSSPRKRQHLVAEGINFFCTGAGSSVRKPKSTVWTKFAQGVPGFTTVSLQPDWMLIRMTHYRGRALYSASVQA